MNAVSERAVVAEVEMLSASNSTSAPMHIPSTVQGPAQMLRMIASHQGSRRVIGTRCWSVESLNREVQIWKLDDEECLILFIQASYLQHWEHSRAALEEMQQVFLDWLTAS